MAEIYRERYRAELEGGVYLGFHIVVQLEGGIQLYSVMVGTRKSLINIYIHRTITTTTENRRNVGVTKRLEGIYSGWVDKHRWRERGMNDQMDGNGMICNVCTSKPRFLRRQRTQARIAPIPITVMPPRRRKLHSSPERMERC